MITNSYETPLMKELEMHSEQTFLQESGGLKFGYDNQAGPESHVNIWNNGEDF